jgi:Domain of unknown function (DUF4159)
MHLPGSAFDRIRPAWRASTIWLCGLSLLTVLLSGSVSGADNKLPRELTDEFQFVRMIYQDYGGSGGWRRRGGRWTTDAPEAETHFLGGIRRLTNVDAAADGIVLDVTDDALFDYPFLYAVEVGHWYLDDQRAQRLRDYLLRGGTLMVDDFHGTREWAIFAESMQRVFPDRPIVDLADADAVFHVVYNVDHRIQIPGIGAAMRGVTYEQDGFTPYWRGILDDDGRLMVIINFNMDLGDAWEHADNPLYPQPYTLLAYQTGINYLLYAMTH